MFEGYGVRGVWCVNWVVRVRDMVCEDYGVRGVCCKKGVVCEGCGASEGVGVGCTRIMFLSMSRNIHNILESAFLR